MSNKIVAIAGLNGRMALLIAQHLLVKPDVVVHGIVRNPSKLPTTFTSNPRVKVFQAESSDVEAIKSAVRGATIAICCYHGSNDFMVESQKTMIDACIAAGVPRYMASDWSFDWRKLAFGDHPLKDPMKHVAAYLDEKEGQIKAVHVFNGALMDFVFSTGPWNAETNTLSFWGDGNDKFEMTTYSDAAAYSAEVAYDDSASGYFCFRGDFLTFKEMAVCFEDVYGKAPKLESGGSLDECIRVGRHNLQTNPDNVWGWAALFYFYWCLNGQVWSSEKDIVNNRYPAVKVTTLRDLLQKRSREDLMKLNLDTGSGSLGKE